MTKGVNDVEVAKKLVNLEQSASSRGIHFDLSFQTVKKVLNSEKCYFTGVLLNNKQNDPNQLTFDRVDNNKGYVDGNVVACAKYFNELKSNLTIEQVKLLVKAFKRKKLW